MSGTCVAGLVTTWLLEKPQSRPRASDRSSSEQVQRFHRPAPRNTAPSVFYTKRPRQCAGREHLRYRGERIVERRAPFLGQNEPGFSQGTRFADMEVSGQRVCYAKLTSHHS